MSRVTNFLRPLTAVLFLVLTLATASAVTDHKFSTSPTLAREASTFVKLLEQAHYNHDAVRSSDYAQVVPDYMTELDGQHLFFLGTDKAAFAEKYGKSVYYNVAFLGNINAAYEMYDIYQSRVVGRINWIFDELKKDVDLTANETYRVDRTKSEWPSDAAAADDLWRKRIKFELVGELLNSKKPDDAKKKEKTGEQNDRAQALRADAEKSR
jgi:carboxyl-terminal processing protease